MSSDIIEDDSRVDKKETTTRTSPRLVQFSGGRPEAPLTIEQASHTLQAMLETADLDHETLKTAVSAFGPSIVAQLKGAQLKAIGTALEWESTTGGQAVLLPKVFTWLYNSGPGSYPLAKASADAKSSLTPAPKALNPTAQEQVGDVGALVAGLVTTEMAKVSQTMQRAQLAQFEQLSKSLENSISSLKMKGAPAQRPANSDHRTRSNSQLLDASSLSVTGHAPTETSKMMAELRSGTQRALQDLGYNALSGREASQPTAHSFGVPALPPPSLSRLGFTKEDMQKVPHRQHVTRQEIDLDEPFDDGRLHHAMGDNYTAPAFVSGALRRHKSMFTLVSQGITWQKTANRREAINLACILDFLLEGSPKDATEVLVSRLRAVMHADDKGSWQIARHFESKVTEDMPYIEARPLRAAIRTANLYERATVYERKNPEEQDLESPRASTRRR